MLSRGNDRATVFHSANEYSDFIALLDEAREHFAVELFAFCIMPNHFHLVARCAEASELSGLMQWWLTSHVRRHQKRNGTSGHGHIWQGRFKSFPIQEDEHLLTVVRYVLMNPCRARLCPSPWAWQWSSLWHDAMLTALPVALPQPMRQWLATPITEHERENLRLSVVRGAPFGDQEWQKATARAGGLLTTLRPRGRPRVALAFPAPDQQTLL